DEIRQICAHLRAVSVRNFQSKIVVLDISLHAWVGFGNPAELGLPIAVENDPVDMTPARVRHPAVLFGGIEVYVDSGAGRVIRVEHDLDGPFAHQRPGYGCCDALA